MKTPFINKSKHSAMYTKYYCLTFLIFSFSLLIAPSGFAQSTILKKGETAPLFNAKASLAGSEFDFSLKNLPGQRAVLFDFIHFLLNYLFINFFKIRQNILQFCFMLLIFTQLFINKFIKKFARTSCNSLIF